MRRPVDRHFGNFEKVLSEKVPLLQVVFYCETIKRDPNERLVYECRCDERLKTKTEKCTLLSYTVLCGELEHLKIETRLMNERFASVMGEFVIVTLKVYRLYSK
jgi:hypothetical protein